MKNNFLLLFVIFFCVSLIGCDREKAYNINYTFAQGPLEGVSKETVLKSEFPFELPKLTKDNFIFLGWYDNPDFSGEAIAIITDAKDYQLYALWVIDSYIVTFDGQGAELLSGEMIITIDYGEDFIAPVYQKEGYRLRGWFLDQDVFQLEFNSERVLVSEVTLYALWVIDGPFLVTFNGSGGTLVSGEEELTVESGVELTAPTYEKEGYEFVSWDEDLSHLVPGMIVSAQWAIKPGTPGLEYQSTEEGYIVTGYKGSEKELYIPLEYNNGYDGTKRVIEIAQNAFHSKGELTKVTLPKSIISIGDWAFYGCSDLLSISLPDNLLIIGDNSFLRCRSLLSFNVSQDSLYFKEINGVLYNKDVTVLHRYPEGKADSDFVVPDSVTNIRTRALSECNNLENITLPDSVTSFGYSVFSESLALSEVRLSGNIARIEMNAFSKCSSLRNVLIPRGVTCVGEGAFFLCTSLSRVIIANTVTCLEKDAFAYCRALFNVDLAWNTSGLKTIGEGVFKGCGQLMNFQLPSRLESIGTNAFASCALLTRIVLPRGIIKIEKNVFYDCTSLTEVVLANDTTEIGEYAFAGCSALTNIVLSPSITKIGSYAFSHCTSLTTIVIPTSVVTVGEDLFNNSDNLIIYTLYNYAPDTWIVKWNSYKRPVRWGELPV